MPAYIPIIGLEVHAQLNTRSKMFCGCPVSFAAEPNSHVCPVCLGYPGALPVMNSEALKMTALTGLLLNCRIAEICKFDRKNYFYPDMPKNYQITQYDMPICIGGGVPLHEFAYPKDAQKSIRDPGRVVRLTRIHLEEDVAKSTHFETSSGIDFNRAGTPLMEIVSEPDIETPEEAFAYLTSLQQILVYGGVSDADMEKGQLRCDCNISVRPEGQSELGVKIEIKNMNSISAVRRAVAYEIGRQIDCATRGERLIQSTRRWDDAAGQTFQMRTKESAHDYRYFPDPDLLPVKTGAFMDEVRARRPELPGEKRDRFVAQFGVTPYDASVLASGKALADWFEQAVAADVKVSAKKIANWVINELLGALNDRGLTIKTCPIEPAVLPQLVAKVESGKISNTHAKEVLIELLEESWNAATTTTTPPPVRSPEQIIADKGFEQVSDTGAIETLCRQVMEANPKAVAEYKSGKTGSINFLKGQVLKLSQGKANPQVVNDVLARLLA